VISTLRESVRGDKKKRFNKRLVGRNHGDHYGGYASAKNAWGETEKTKIVCDGSKKKVRKKGDS